MRLIFSLKSLCRGVVILLKRPCMLMNMTKTMRDGKRGRRNGRLKKHVLRFSFSRQAFVPYPHLFLPWSIISLISSATVWTCSNVSRRSKNFAKPSSRISERSVRFLPFLQTAITFDLFGVTGATTYQNEALFMFYVSNGSNYHRSVLCAE